MTLFYFKSSSADHVLCYDQLEKIVRIVQKFERLDSYDAFKQRVTHRVTGGGADSG